MIIGFLLGLILCAVPMVAQASDNEQLDYDYADPKDVFFGCYKLPRARLNNETPIPGGLNDDHNAIKQEPVDKSTVIRFRRELQPRTGTEPDTLKMEDSMTEREPRGFIREQWIKQPYPVVRSEMDTAVPRVHFVTRRRRPDSRQSPFPPPPPSDFDRVDKKEFWERPDFYRSHYDPYPRYESDQYSYNRRGAGDRPMVSVAVASPTARQGRIIYYATLPEVVRAPQDVHVPINAHPQPRRYRTGYYYHNDDLANEDVPPNDVDRYRYRKQRVEPDTRAKTRLYPVKVATNVNVRNTKKSPERRIYSEVDTRHPPEDDKRNRTPENNYKLSSHF